MGPILKQLSELYQANVAGDQVLKRRAVKSIRSGNWRQWIAGVLTRRGRPTSLETCAYGKLHWVKEVHKIGGKGYWFLSGGCGGCSKHLFKSETMPDGPNECAILEYPIVCTSSKKTPEVGKMFQV